MNKNNIYKFFRAKGLLLIILLAIVIRMGFFVSLQPWNKEVVEKTIVVQDAFFYNQLATSFLHNKSFIGFNGFRTPGYPLFIAMLYSISNSSVWFVLLIQILLSTFSVFLVFKIASTLFSRKIAFFSAFLFAIDLHQALFAVTLLSDTLFVFLFLSSAFYLFKSLKESNYLSVGLSAFILGISSMERPVGSLFPIMVIFFILVLSNLKLKKRLSNALIFSVIFVATISPWLIRNYVVYGEAKLTTQSGFNLLYCNVTATEAYKTGKPEKQVINEFTDLAIKQGLDTINGNPFKTSQIYTNVAMHYIKNNFTLYCRRHFMGIVNMYAGLSTQAITSTFHLKSNALSYSQYEGPNIFLRTMDFFKSKTTVEIFIAIVLGFYLLTCYFFTIYAICHLIRKKERIVYLFILIILYFSVLTGVFGITRLRIPFMPFINILCAVGLFHFYDKIKARFSSAQNY